MVVIEAHSHFFGLPAIFYTDKGGRKDLRVWFGDGRGAAAGDQGSRTRVHGNNLGSASGQPSHRRQDNLHREYVGYMYSAAGAYPDLWL